MKNKPPTIKEIDEALKPTNAWCPRPETHPEEWCMDASDLDVIVKTAQAMRNLLQAIEDGKLAVVPVEATDDMQDGMFYEGTLKAMDSSSPVPSGMQRRSMIYKAAIKAAPDMIEGLWND